MPRGGDRAKAYAPKVVPSATARAVKRGGEGGEGANGKGGGNGFECMSAVVAEPEELGSGLLCGMYYFS